MNGISGMSHWTADHASNVNGAGTQPRTGASFEQALKAGGASDHRAYAFNELGMFGTQQALDLPAVGRIDPAHFAGSVASPSPIPAPQAARPTTDAPLPELKAGSRSLVLAVPAEPDDEARLVSSTQVDPGRSESQSLGETADPGPFSPKATIPVSLSVGSDARPRAVVATNQIEALAELAVGEGEGNSSFVEPKPEATQSTETWLTLNIADGLVSVAMRDIDAADQNTDRLKARIEDVLAEHGLGLSTFTLNGAEAPNPKITRKGA